MLCKVHSIFQFGSVDTSPLLLVVGDANPEFECILVRPAPNFLFLLQFSISNAKTDDNITNAIFTPLVRGSSFFEQ
jgi:hypothetical protein